MTTTKPKYWIGSPPAVCDTCKAEITTVFVDGKTRMGPWANMCNPCFRRLGLGLGMGKAQRYEKQDDGRWLKTGG